MKDYKGKSGIYKIQNLTTGKVYIGKTKCFYKRYYQYVSDVRNKSKERINSYLLNAFSKYGFDNFSFEVIEFCSLDECSERELFWMTHYDSTNPEKGYNLRKDSSTSMIVHPLTSEKISNNLKQQWEQGLRSDHSDKLKDSWSNRDKTAQSKLLTKTLTKYLYVLHFEDNVLTVNYSELKRLGYSGVLSSFHRLKKDDVIYKGIRIERVVLNENQM